MRKPNPWRPDPDDERIPIGPGDASVHRSSAIVTQPMLHVPNQSLEHAQYVIVGGFTERGIGQIHSIVKKKFMFHCQILQRLAVVVYSYFPKVGFVHPSMKRHSALLPKTVPSIPHQTLLHGVDMGLTGVVKRLAGEINRLVLQLQ